MEFIASQPATLLEVLGLNYPDCSKATLRSWINERRISVNGTIVKRTDKAIATGDAILVGKKKVLIASRFPVIYSDKDIILIDKPSGLLSVATDFDKKDNVFSLLKEHFYPREVFVVHRLDQDTSGVMMFALSAPAFRVLKTKFAAHDIVRRYTAIVEGSLTTPGTWDSYLYEDKNYVVRFAKNPGEGERAITHFKPLMTERHYTWLELTLETGKKNQIRVQCLHAGCPVVGDKKYGPTESPLKRLCLHAHHLEFDHPITGKRVVFTSAVPTSFYRLLDPRKLPEFKANL